MKGKMQKNYIWGTITFRYLWNIKNWNMLSLMDCCNNLSLIFDFRVKTLEKVETSREISVLISQAIYIIT